jgi:hypothetical protein
VRAISITYRREFQPGSATAEHVPHDSLRADLSFLDKKINLRCRTYRHKILGFDKQTTQAYIANP